MFISRSSCNYLIKKKRFNPMLCAFCYYTIRKSASTCPNWKKTLEVPDNEKAEIAAVENEFKYDAQREAIHAIEQTD